MIKPASTKYNARWTKHTPRAQIKPHILVAIPNEESSTPKAVNKTAICVTRMQSAALSHS